MNAREQTKRIKKLNAKGWAITRDGPPIGVGGYEIFLTKIVTGYATSRAKAMEMAIEAAEASDGGQ